MPDVPNLTASIIRDVHDAVAPCLLPERPDPCSIIIFGASGDLAARKLFPALFRLYRSGGLPQAFAIVGAARSEMDNKQFRSRIRSSLESHSAFDADAWTEFGSRILYHQLDYGSVADFEKLRERLEGVDTSSATGANRIFYLATPPSVYEEIASTLGTAGLARENESSFARLVVEKPFGHDLPSARRLDSVMHTHFREHQIFRIDHYLAKETVQNILMFRFANSIFEPVWNRRYIDYVTCASTETLGVGRRAGYYEKSGVLRDMFQNHMMQVLSMVAIEPPSVFEANRVRDEKVKLYRALRPFEQVRLRQDLVLGQYTAGSIGDEQVAGYLEEDGVRSDSLTPTFAALRVHIDNWRWQGVPFNLISGKRLREKLTRIIVQFKPVPHSLFRGVIGDEISANRLVMDVYPDNAVSLMFQAKAPGAAVCLNPVTMRFDFGINDSKQALGAYEKVLLDCMLGDHMLFWRQDGVELCWGYLTPILDMCEACGDVREHLHQYESGTWGPARSLDLVNTLF